MTRVNLSVSPLQCIVATTEFGFGVVSIATTVIFGGPVVQVLALGGFVVPADEEVDDPDSDLTAHIVATIDIVDLESAEDLLEEAPQNRVSHNTALTNVDSLISYAEQRPAKASDMRALHSLCRLIH